jgi:tetratricopeptide (TPR) repeat protein
MGAKEQALEAFNQSIQLYGYSNNYLWKAMVLMDIGQFQSAADLYRIVSEMDGVADAEKVLYYNNEGFALYMAKKYDQAMDIIEKAMLLDPSRPAIYKNKGLILEAEGKYHEAFAAYNDALVLDNQYDKARNAKYSLMAKLNGGIDPASMEAWGTLQTGVEVDKVWTIGFNLPVDLEDAASQIVITDQMGNRLPLSITTGGEDGTVRVGLAGGQKYLPGTRYVLYVLGNVKGKYASQMKNGMFMEFITKQ